MLSLVLTAALQVAAGVDAGAARGRALFDGTAALRGRIAAHQDPLPAAVLACGNCHGSGGSGGSGARPAPRLDAGWLSEYRTRRNGPSGAYDAATFCTTLRTGVDPVQVRLPLRMPRYELSDDDCAALWRYLALPASLEP